MIVRKVMQMAFICIFSFLFVCFTQYNAVAEANPDAQGSYANYADIPRPLKTGLCGAMSYQTEAQYLERLSGVLHHGHRPNALDQDDVDQYIQFSLVKKRADQVRQVLQADLDNDGKVTKEELQKTYNSPPYSNIIVNPKFSTGAEGNGTLVSKLMKLDLNGDGIIDYSEMRQIDNGEIDAAAKNMKAFLELAPDKKLLTADVLEGLGHKTFATVDLNHDKVLSREECKLLYADSIRSNPDLMKMLNSLRKKQ
jgi:Ca2+-binding EF-hand superfamily protein